jgi:LemA protein
MFPVIFVVGIALVLFLIGLSIYNGLIRKKNNVKNTFSTIDVMLKKRHDLIPNLVETVKKYMQHERETLTEIVKLRSQIVDNSNISDDERMKLESQLSSKLSGLKINIENYPDLKANTNFLSLQDSMNENEAQLSAARRTYNAAVLDYNNALEMFPSNMFASRMNYKPANFIEIPEAERANPDVKSLFE